MFKSSSKAILAALAVLAFSATAFAADAPAKSEKDVKDLARVEVTGSRIAESIDDVPASSYVITRDDIDSSGARNVMELLGRIPGIIGINTQGAAMSFEKNLVKMRGLGDEVLLMVDGVPYMSTNGMSGYNAFDLRAIPMEDIERVEVVKGASSAVYGSGAAGGVINVITRKGEEKSSASTKIESGSNGWFRGAVRGTAVTESGMKATLGYSKTRETGDILIAKKPDGQIQNNLDYDENAYNIRLEKGHWTLAGDWGNYDSAYENISPNPMYSSKTTQYNRYARTSLSYNDGTNIARLYYHDDHEEYSNSNIYDEDTWGATFNRSQELWGHTFVYGFDFRSEKLERADYKTGRVDVDRTRNGIAPYIETTIALGAINMDLGLRYEHWSVDEADDVDEIMPRISFNYETESGKLLYATVGRFFMNPNFFQMTYDGQAWVEVSPGDWQPGPMMIGNPSLKPEKGWTYDLGIKDRKAKNPWAINLFHIELDDKISYNYTPNPLGDYSYINVSEYRASGFEADYTFNLSDAWKITPGISFTDAENKITSGSPWTRTSDPRWDVSAFINYSMNEWKSELGLHYYKDRAINNKAYDDDNLFMADFSLVWTPEKLEGNILRFTCTNIFDKDYIIDDSGFLAPERRFVISWEHQFKSK